MPKILGMPWPRGDLFAAEARRLNVNLTGYMYRCIVGLIEQFVASFRRLRPMPDANGDSEDIALQLSIAEAKAIIRGGHGELELVTSFCAPYCVLDENRKPMTRNGTAFSPNAGQGPFGVTVCHVIAGWRIDRQRSGGPFACYLPSPGQVVQVGLPSRVLDQVTREVLSILNREAQVHVRGTAEIDCGQGKKLTCTP
jgi:hypothetical protein